MFDYIENTLINADIYIKKLFEKINSEEGASTAEYIILIAIIALAAIAAVNLVGNAVKGKASEAAGVIGSANFNPN